MNHSLYYKNPNWILCYRAHIVNRFESIDSDDEARDIIERIWVENSNVDGLTQRYASTQAVQERISNYYHILNTLK